MSIATRALFTGAASDPFGTIAPSGSRVALASGDYNGSPGMTLLTGDDLMLVYRYGAAHTGGGALIDERVSTDLGVTWPGGGTTIVTASGTNDVRDPCILRLSTGRLLVGYTTREPHAGDDFEAVTVYSDDAGSTWSSEYILPTSGFSGPLLSFTSSQPVELDDGTVIITGYAEDNGPWMTVLWRSTDEGETFAAPEIVASHATRDYIEPQMRVLASGLWLILMRSESNHHTWRTYSDDEGATWSTPDDVNEMTGRPDFVEYRPGRLIQFGRFDTVGDSPGYYAFSRGSGASWSEPLEIDAGETDLWVYGAPVVVSPGVVVIGYALEASASDANLFFRTFED